LLRDGDPHPDEENAMPTTHAPHARPAHDASTARFLLRSACVAGLVALAVAALAKAPRADARRPAQQVTSRDGTRIAFDTTGRGPALILVGGALSDRSGGADLARLLAPHLTVYSYDRRGRGDSGDTAPYAVRREVEDIEALIDHAGGSAFVYGKSSGASLALQAASALGDKVRKLALYEAPYDDAEGAAMAWKTFTEELDALLAAHRHAEAIARFMAFVGAPDAAVQQMKASPAWPGMLAMAPTLAYDNAVVGVGRAVPVGLAAQVKAPTLVMDGSASAGPMPFMRATADQLGRVIPDARRQTLDGQAHDVNAKALAPVLRKFFAD
jgi:pimeloyl-ACP methyl ester carboxylesterase